MASRLKLDWVDCSADAHRALARVQLSLDDGARTGAATAPMSETAWQRAVAEATLRAIAAFVGGATVFTLDSVAEVRTGRHPLIVGTIVMHDGRRGGARAARPHPRAGPFAPARGQARLTRGSRGSGNPLRVGSARACSISR